MINKMLFIIIFMLILLCVFPDSKIDKIGVFDLEQVVDVIISGKSSAVFQQIKQDKQLMQDNLNKIKENIAKLDEEKSKEKDDVKKVAYDKKIDELKKQYADYYKITSNQIDQKQKNFQEPIFKEIYTAVKRISESEGYTIIFNSKSDGLFYYSLENDITQKIIDSFKLK
jgi:Skp family chaperone for outer membrane proteins